MPSNPYAREGSYVTGAVVRPEEGWLVLTIDELVKRDIANSGVFYFEAGKLWPIKPTRFRTRFCARDGINDADLLLVGEYGQCAVVSRQGTIREEQIQVNGTVPEDRGPLRAGVKLGGSVVVVGMDRQVYRRDQPGSWVAMEVGLPLPSDDVCGFEAVAAGLRGELIAVGWDGEIWLHDAGRWHPIDSPTNSVLTCLCCMPSGEFFAGGRKGLLLRGRGDQWTVIDDSGCPDDLTGLVAVEGVLYAASLRTLYRWNGTQLEPVADGALPASFAIFSSNSSAVWSIGSKAVLTFERGAWRHIA